MASDRVTIDLTDQDVADLAAWKRFRLKSLKTNRNHYTWGTLHFWHALYKKEGEAGVLSLLQSLDHQKLHGLRLDSPAFWLMQDEPDLFIPYLTGASSTRATKALDDIAFGMIPSDASDLLDRVSRRAVIRWLSRDIGRGGPQQTARNWPLILEMSRQSPRFKGILAEFLDTSMDNPKAQLLSRARWSHSLETMKQTVEILPLTQERKKAMLAKIYVEAAR